jgi:hypothetical protein
MKYLFTAHFENGPSYFQNFNDESLVNPQKSCYFDIEQRIAAGEKLWKFDLVGAVFDNHTYSVNLIDGHFEVDGAPFTILNDAARREHQELRDFRLIYFRRVLMNFVATQEIQKEVAFHLGWQANDNGGNNHQQIIRIT